MKIAFRSDSLRSACSHPGSLPRSPPRRVPPSVLPGVNSPIELSLSRPNGPTQVPRRRRGGGGGRRPVCELSSPERGGSQLRRPSPRRPGRGDSAPPRPRSRHPVLTWPASLDLRTGRLPPGSLAPGWSAPNRSCLGDRAAREAEDRVRRATGSAVAAPAAAAPGPAHAEPAQAPGPPWLSTCSRQLSPLHNLFI